MAVGLLGIPNALGTEPLIVSVFIAVSAAMMRPIMLTSTTSRKAIVPAGNRCNILYLFQDLLVDSQRRVDFSLFNIHNILFQWS